MTIGPNSKKINEAIKDINKKLIDSNKEALLGKDDIDVTTVIKNQPKVDPTKVVKSFVNSSSTDFIKKTELLSKLKDSKNKLKAINLDVFTDSPSEEMDTFFREALPKKVSAAIVYDSKSNFNVNTSFEKWATNFIFTDDIKNAYVSYDSSIMSSKSVSNKSEFSNYCTTEGLVDAEVLFSKVSDELNKYEADAENVLVISQDLLTKDTNALEEFAKAELNKDNILSHSKYVLWGDTKDSIIKVGSMEGRKKYIASQTFDDKGLLFEGEKKTIDKLRKSFRENPKRGYGVVVPNEDKDPTLKYIVPDCLKYLASETKNGKYNLKIVDKNNESVNKATMESIKAANSPVGNLTAENTHYGTYTMSEAKIETLDKDGKKVPTISLYDFNNGSSYNSGFIGDVIYQLYQSAQKNNMLSVAFGRTVNAAHKSGVSTKSEMDLQTISSASFSFGADTPFATLGIDRKLHVATCIGFTMYTKYGMETTGYISSSSETIPATTRHSMFALGRITAMGKYIHDGIYNQRPYNNNVIRALIASGPDFMSNMFDAYIVKHSDNEILEMIKLTTSPKVLEATSKKSKPEAVNGNDISSNLPITTNKMLSSKSDFVTRITSLSVPGFKKELINYSFLNQQYTVPGYMLEHDFSSALNVELDNNLDYLRLINYMAGFANSYHSAKANNDYNSIQYRPLRNRALEAQKISIVVRIVPNSMFLGAESNNYVVFEDVIFLGGGDVNFSQSSSDLVTATFKFIYKNVWLAAGGDNTTYAKLEDNNTISFGPSNIVYAPVIQQQEFSRTLESDSDSTKAFKPKWLDNESIKSKLDAKAQEKKEKKEAKKEKKLKEKELENNNKLAQEGGFEEVK